MKRMNKRIPFSISVWISVLALLLFLPAPAASGADLKEIKERGVLRHLGIVYANFVTGSGDGLDVEIVKLFADHLGVRYEFVETSWGNAIGDLTGKKVLPKGDDIEIVGEQPVKGDIIASGFTILPWRQKFVEFSTPSFPSQIWLITRTDSALAPIQPTGSVDKDIAAVKQLLQKRSVLGIADTCLDPNLYGIKEAGALTIDFAMTINALVPAVINAEAETTLLEVPDALAALQKWPGKIKVIGPLSTMQAMGCAFDKGAPDLRDEFNRFFEQCKKNGAYALLIKKYYPLVFDYYPEFFQVNETN